MLCVAMLVFCLLVASSHAVVLNEIDTFQSGHTENWTSGGPNSNPPALMLDSGPAGSGDHAIVITSTGAGHAGSKLVAFNKMQWTGDHTAAGISGISMHLHNVGNNPLNIRLSINGAGGKFSTTNAIALAAQSGWTSGTLSTNAGDWTAVVNGTDIAATLANVTEVRLLSAATPSWQGQTVAAELHVDNIRVVPEPTTPGLLVIAALGCLRFRRR
jgi:hypothetical protein